MSKVPAVFLFVVLLFSLVVFAITAYDGMRQLCDWKSDQNIPEVVPEVVSASIPLLLHILLIGVNILLWMVTGIKYNQLLEFSPSKAYFYPIVVGVLALPSLFIYLVVNLKQMIDTEVDSLRFIFLFFVFFLYIIGIGFIISLVSTKDAKANAFLGDQMCSQVPVLRKVGKVVCLFFYFITKKCDNGFCKTNTVYKFSSYVISCIPFLYRGFQCGHKWYYEGQICHLINLGKYVCAMAEALVIACENHKTTFSLWLLVPLIATVYQFLWDVIKDWGLLNSKNRWLRNKLILRPKYIYYLSMVFNLILRFAWALPLLIPTSECTICEVTSWISLAEVTRRAQWNFYRLENEEAETRDA